MKNYESTQTAERLNFIHLKMLEVLASEKNLGHSSFKKTHLKGRIQSNITLRGIRLF